MGRASRSAPQADDRISRGSSPRLAPAMWLWRSSRPARRMSIP